MYGAYFMFETYVRIILVLLAYMYRVTSNKSRVPNNGRVFIISRLTVQMSRVVEDCHRMWRQKPEKPVCRRYRDWTAVQQVGWWKSTGISVEMARQRHGWSMTTDTLVHCRSQLGRLLRRSWTWSWCAYQKFYGYTCGSNYAVPPFHHSSGVGVGPRVFTSTGWTLTSLPSTTTSRNSDTLPTCVLVYNPPTCISGLHRCAILCRQRSISHIGRLLVHVTRCSC